MALPYDFYPAVLYALDKMGQGETRTRACDQANINIATFENYLKNDPKLQMLAIEAERRGYDAMADALLRPDNHETYGQTNPQMAKVVSDNIKWFLSRKDPKRFGEKIEIKHELTLDRAITDAMNAARRRVQDRTIEHDDVDMPTPPMLIEGVVDDVIDVLTEDDELMAELLR